MSAVMKRVIEFLFFFGDRLYFIAVFYVLLVLLFVTCLLSGNSSLSYTFSNMFAIAVFLVPVLTMRLWSEERSKNRSSAVYRSG